MRTTGHGLQIFLVATVIAGGSLKQIGSRWSGFENNGTETVREALREVQAAQPAGGCQVQMPATQSLDSLHSLRRVAADRGLQIGTAVEPRELASDETYRSTVSREFSTLTPENVMKFDHIHPAPETYEFCDGDAVVSYATANHMQVRGHTLVWHNQLPGWLTAGEFSREQLISILHDHIQTVVSHYRGQVWAWDVVNEAFESDGSLRDSLWLRGIGPEYIEMAFRFAHEADPDALLFYNDFGAEGMGTKSDAVYALLARLRSQGVPVHGAGLQMHLEAGSGQGVGRDQIERNMRRLAGLGLEIHVTEMDVRVALPATGQSLATQAGIYREVVGACVSVSACRSITFWGFTDRHSWVSNTASFAGFGAALLFDDAYSTKPAYAGVREALVGGVEFPNRPEAAGHITRG